MDWREIFSRISQRDYDPFCVWEGAGRERECHSHSKEPLRCQVGQAKRGNGEQIVHELFPERSIVALKRENVLFRQKNVCLCVFKAVRRRRWWRWRGRRMIEKEKKDEKNGWTLLPMLSCIPCHDLRALRVQHHWLCCRKMCVCERQSGIAARRCQPRDRVRGLLCASYRLCVYLTQLLRS